MSESYKGISKLDSFSNGQYPVWKRLVLGFFAEHAKLTYAVLTAATDAEIAAMSEADRDAVRATLANNLAARTKHLAIAGADVLKFLGPSMTQLHVRTVSGRDIWDALASEYAEWQDTQAPVLHLELLR